MNVQTITMPKDKAREAFLQYRGSVKERMGQDYRTLMRGYRALMKGQAIIDFADVAHRLGLDHLLQPRIAIARAGAERVWFHGWSDGSARFAINRDGSGGSWASVRLPSQTFPEGVKKWSRWESELGALVPTVPPRFKPKFALSNYHMIWEPDWERQPPYDPILCKRIGPSLFVVLAQWDLTELERAVIRGREAR